MASLPKHITSSIQIREMLVDEREGERPATFMTRLPHELVNESPAGELSFFIDLQTSGRYSFIHFQILEFYSWKPPPPPQAHGALKRIQRELRDLQKDPPDGFSLGPEPDDLFNWCGAIIGPQGSPWEGGVFVVRMKLPSDYPFKCPQLRWETKIYHPNINDLGHSCSDFGSWSPALTLQKLLRTQCSLLVDPNPHDPLNIPAADLYKTNRTRFNAIAKEWTTKFASKIS